MGREKHCVHKNFTKSVVEGQNNKSVVKTKCNHCNWENALNTTRMIKHIKDCLKCPKEIKEKVSGEKHDAKEETIENLEHDEQILEKIEHVSNPESKEADVHITKKKKFSNSSMDNFIFKDKTVTEALQVSLFIFFFFFLLFMYILNFLKFF